MQVLVRSRVTFSDRSLDDALHRAIWLANGQDPARACPKPQFVDLLIGRGAAVNRAVDDPPLSVAAAHDAVSAAASLIAHGARVNARNRFGETALHRAARSGAAGVAALLVKHGADVNARDAIEDFSATPLLRLAASAERDRLPRFIETARALLAGNANPNLRNAAGNTPLNLAVIRDLAPLVRVLLDAEGYPDIAGNDLWTPLHHAAQGGKLPLAQMLIDRGAALDPKNRDGETPLWRTVLVVSGNGGPAKQRDVYAVLQLLIARGADVNVLTARDYSMLDHAVANRDDETARFLLARGARGSAFTLETLAGRQR